MKAKDVRRILAMGGDFERVEIREDRVVVHFWHPQPDDDANDSAEDDREQEALRSWVLRTYPQTREGA